MHKNNRKTFKDSESYDLEEEVYETPKKWFDEIAEDPKRFETVTEQILIELKDEAKKCHDSEVANYNIKNSKTNTNYQWMKTVMSKGTVSDKVAAYTVAIQDNPVCGLETLRNLVNMIKAGKKKECVVVMDVLTDLFLTDLLRPDQKLRLFHQRPLSLLNELSSGNAITRRKILSTWYFEDQLKELYFTFVTALNNLGHDSVEKNKEKSISAMYKLLAGNPEQEKNLLAFIVNKLGDPSQKVASKAIYSLGQLLFKHSNMQGVVLNEVEKLLFRPNVSTKAQYYGLCFLSQFYLSNETSEVARKLIEVYFSFFRACIKKGEVDSRMMSALLMGVNRAYPYAKLEMGKISEHIDTMYRIVHIASFNIGLHALSLLYQVSDFGNNVSERFYSALYKKLLDPKLLTTTHQAMLLSLIYKALLKDPEVSRIKAFIKRLLQLCFYMQPGFACGVLFLISRVIGKRKNVQALTLERKLPNDLDEDDGEEKYQDIKDEDDLKPANDDEDDDDVKPDLDKLNESLSGPSWYHCENASKKKSGAGVVPDRYNPSNRNPLYAGADFTAYTELLNLRSHFHPTVALYATNILDGDLIKYSGDPLKDFTLIRFLDRFVFKNPRKVEDGVKKGAHPTFGKRKIYQAKGLKALAVTSDSYLRENQRKIPVDEVFMHTFLQRKYFEKKMRKDYDEDDDNSDLESVQSDEFEEMLDKMGGNYREEDDDLDFMTDIGQGLKKDKKKKRKDDAGDADSEADLEEEDLEIDENDLSGDEIDGDESEDFDDDLEMNEDDKELFEDLDGDDDDEDIVFEENESSRKKFKANTKGGDDITSLFASAEEFSSLLEDEGSSKVAPGGSNAFSNEDKANVKQLAWEEKRNRWLKGFDNAIGKKKARFGKKRK